MRVHEERVVSRHEVSGHEERVGSRRAASTLARLAFVSALALASAARAPAPNRPPPRTPAATSHRARNREWALKRRGVDGDGAPTTTTKRRRAGANSRRAESTRAELYQTINIDPSVTFPNSTDMSADADALLASLASVAPPLVPAPLPSTPLPPSDNPVLWGGLSTGPVLRSILIDQNFSAPTAIQRAAFEPIARGQNALLSAQTGSGKTLAFLLPLISTLRRDGGVQAMVVCPSHELALQLRKSVDLLWPPRDGASALHVLPAAPRAEDEAAVTALGTQLLLDMSSPIVAATPYTAHAVFHAVSVARRRAGWRPPAPRGRGRALGRGSPQGRGGRAPGRGSPRGRGDQPPRSPPPATHRPTPPHVKAAANEFVGSLRALVLDEADQLLDSDVIAEQRRLARQLVEEQGSTLTARQRAAIKGRSAPTVTENMLRNLPVALGSLQLICATASASRTLRQQLMPLVGAPSLDASLPLISDDARTALAQTPSSIEHKFVVCEPTDDAADALVLLRRVMDCLPVADAIVFADRALGVRKTADALRELGLRRVQTLAGGGEEAAEDEEEAEAGGASRWEEATIYVSSEKFARGLDLCVGYVFLLSPPATTASYLHLSGRTGRQGACGVALTLVSAQQSPRLAAFSRMLRIPFQRVQLPPAAAEL